MNEEQFEKSKVCIRDFITFLKEAISDLKDGSQARSNFVSALGSLRSLQEVVMECEGHQSRSNA